MRVLLVEDEPLTLSALSRLFQRHGHTVTGCTTGTATLQRVKEQAYDVVVLDWGLPDVAGPQVIKELRRRNSWIPVLMLTGRMTREDLVEALRAGADDFVRKTEEAAVLVTRCEALVRRSSYPRTSDRMIEASGLIVEETSGRMTVRGQAVQLSKSELALLAVLVESMGEVVSRTILVQRVWGDEASTDSNTALEQVVTRLRRKLGEEGERLRAIRRQGYVLVPHIGDPTPKRESVPSDPCPAG